MKNIIKFLFIGITVITLTSCEDVVQIKLDEGSKLYVIDAFVNDMEGTQTIRVTTNDTYFSNRQAPPVANAAVVLKDLTGKTYLFEYSGNGNYVYNVNQNDSIALVDHQYELNVTVDGTTYTSLTTQKRTAGIDSLVAMDMADAGFGPPPVQDSIPTYVCMLFAKDRTDLNIDYYWIKTLRNDTLFSGPADINISIDGTNGAVGDAGVDSLSFTPPITFLGFKEYRSGNSCEVQIHSIARETYYFFVQAAAQINNGGLFATTPENVKTNIRTPGEAKTKAIGWFNMATVARKKVTVQ